MIPGTKYLRSCVESKVAAALNRIENPLTKNTLRQDLLPTRQPLTREEQEAGPNFVEDPDAELDDPDFDWVVIVDYETELSPQIRGHRRQSLTQTPPNTTSSQQQGPPQDNNKASVQFEEVASLGTNSVRKCTKQRKHEEIDAQYRKVLATRQRNSPRVYPSWQEILFQFADQALTWLGDSPPLCPKPSASSETDNTE